VEYTFRNVSIQASALIGKAVADGSHVFIHHCDGVKHVVRWNPSTNVFAFDALTEAGAVFSRMSNARPCNCWRLLDILQRYSKELAGLHVTLSYTALDDGPGATFNAALYVVLVTN
jgi:hypothetical protein